MLCNLDPIAKNLSLCDISIDMKSGVDLLSLSMRLSSSLIKFNTNSYFYDVI